MSVSAEQCELPPRTRRARRHGPRARAVRGRPGRPPRPPVRARSCTSGTRGARPDPRIDAVRPDLLHLHSAKAGLAARLAVRGALPTVFQPHAWSFEAAGGPVGAFARHWERYGARWADRLLCVSEAERRTGEQAGVRGEFAVLPNGVDLTAFRPEGGRYAYGDGAPLVVCVGRLCRQKGQDVLLRAWPAVREAVPGARLVLVGDGPDEAALRQQAGAGVEFAGTARDCARWYRAADLVALPSRWEGMALAPLEAMACGRALVLTDTGGARESLPRATRRAHRRAHPPAAHARTPRGTRRGRARARARPSRRTTHRAGRLRALRRPPRADAQDHPSGTARHGCRDPPPKGVDDLVSVENDLVRVENDLLRGELPPPDGAGPGSGTPGTERRVRAEAPRPAPGA
ncbi:glycosyltransferase, partial [Streptomyces sp. NEAU-H3]|uniref:glycosyltransferase n=1 Tax=Streptomyces sp. NEAU-H3 TaxID=2720636 RepID=UPI00280B1F38